MLNVFQENLTARRDAINSSLRRVTNKKNKSSRTFGNLIRICDLSDDRKVVIADRYLTVLKNYEQKVSKYKKFYVAGNTIIQVASVLTPALLTLDTSSGSSVWYIVWGVALTNGLSTSILNLFSINENYFSIQTTFESLLTEGSLFFALSGKYERFETLGDAFSTFCSSVERIHTKEINKEYSDDSSSTAQVTMPKRLTTDNIRDLNHLDSPYIRSPVNNRAEGEFKTLKRELSTAAVTPMKDPSAAPTAGE